MKQTAVEWLDEQMKKCNMTVSVHNTSHQNVIDFYKAIEQAKEMEKKQVINAFGVGCQVESTRLIGYQDLAEQYYNEIFGVQ